jgi:hypothetical protein
VFVATGAGVGGTMVGDGTDVGVAIDGDGTLVGVRVGGPAGVTNTVGVGSSDSSEDPEQATNAASTKVAINRRDAFAPHLRTAIAFGFPRMATPES